VRADILRGDPRCKRSATTIEMACSTGNYADFARDVDGAHADGDVIPNKRGVISARIDNAVVARRQSL
jgi:hypothetical protein